MQKRCNTSFISMFSHETAKLLCYGFSTIQVFGKGLRQSQLKQSMKERLENNKIQPVKEYVGISLWLESNRLFEKTCRCWKQLISMEIFHHSQILTFIHILYFMPQYVNCIHVLQLIRPQFIRINWMIDGIPDYMKIWLIYCLLVTSPH